MKKIIRHYAVDTFSLFAVSLIAQGIIFEDGLVTLLMAGVGLTVASLLAVPILNLLLLPFNLVTFGLFRWVSSAIVLYLVTLVIPGFQIVKFSFAGLSTAWLDLPAIDVSGVLAFIGFSFLLSFLTSIIYWLVKA